MPKRLVVLVSGSGTLLQALLDASAASELGAVVAAVGADRPDAYGLTRAAAAGVPTFVHPLGKGADRAAWDAELTEIVAAHQPDLIISAGFMKLVGAAMHVEPDANGRIQLPASHRNTNGIEKRAVLLGMGEKFELWSEQAHQAKIRQTIGEDEITEDMLDLKL